MDFFLALVLGLGLSAACGFRVFLPPLILGALSHSGQIHLASGFDWLGSPWALAIFGTAAVLEVTAYFVPALDNLLDAAATPAAVAAGTITTASVLVEISPAIRWTVALIAGGGVASIVQLSTVAVRGASTLMSGGMTNAAVASAELASSGIMAFLAVFAPLVAFSAVVALVIAAPWILIKLRRRAARRRGRKRPARVEDRR